MKYTLTESQLQGMIRKCIKECINERKQKEDKNKKVDTIISETIKRVINESNDGLFDVYTSGNGKPVFVTYGGKFYQLPDEMVGMLRELGTKNGRVAFINALQNVPPREKPLDVYSLKMMGYKNRSFNANAF